MMLYYIMPKKLRKQIMENERIDELWDDYLKETDPYKKELLSKTIKKDENNIRTQIENEEVEGLYDIIKQMNLDYPEQIDRKNIEREGILGINDLVRQMKKSLPLEKPRNHKRIDKEGNYIDPIYANASRIQ